MDLKISWFVFSVSALSTIACSIVVMQLSLYRFPSSRRAFSLRQMYPRKGRVWGARNIVLYASVLNGLPHSFGLLSARGWAALWQDAICQLLQLVSFFEILLCRFRRLQTGHLASLAGRWSSNHPHHAFGVGHITCCGWTRKTGTPRFRQFTVWVPGWEKTGNNWRNEKEGIIVSICCCLGSHFCYWRQLMVLFFIVAGDLWGNF